MQTLQQIGQSFSKCCCMKMVISVILIKINLSLLAQEVLYHQGCLEIPETETDKPNVAYTIPTFDSSNLWSVFHSAFVSLFCPISLVFKLSDLAPVACLYFGTRTLYLDSPFPNLAFFSILFFAILLAAFAFDKQSAECESEWVCQDQVNEPSRVCGLCWDCRQLSLENT